MLYSVQCVSTFYPLHKTRESEIRGRILGKVAKLRLYLIYMKPALLGNKLLLIPDIEGKKYTIIKLLLMGISCWKNPAQWEFVFLVLYYMHNYSLKIIPYHIQYKKPRLCHPTWQGWRGPNNNIILTQKLILPKFQRRNSSLLQL